MRKITISTLAILFFTIAIPAQADVYVKVDANGHAIDGPIVCDRGTCGDPSSLYSTLTLKPGERYVLQGTGTVGIGGNNANTEVKVDLQTNVWTVTKNDEENKPVTVQTFKTVEEVTQPVSQSTPTPTPTVAPIVDSITVTTETMTATVQTETTTASVTVAETVTVVTETTTVITSILDETLDMSWEWEKILAWFIAFVEEMYARQS